MTSRNGPESAQPPSPSSPTTAITSQSERDEINTALSRRRRQSLTSVLRTYTQSHVKKPPPQTIREEAADGEDDVSDREVEEEPAEIRGPANGSENDKAINFLSGWRLDHTAAVEINPEEIGEEVSPEFVWDILFENQRGIYLLGKGHFSSATLLPADPTPFTKPAKAVDGASSLSRPGKRSHHWHSIERNGEGSSSGAADEPEQPKVSRFDRKGKAKAKQMEVQRSQAISQAKQRTITTGYTLDTFQTPAPEWVYITPWMINMRVGTDEDGWRYNSWFKKRGWSSHAGIAGWGGWVRRREWVRLRYIGPQTKPGAVEESVSLEGREHVEAVPRRLADVLKSDESRENVQSISKTMAKLSLDRERLETWQSWLDKAKSKKQSPAWKRLEALAKDEQALDELRRQFTYQSNYPSFLSLLSSHGISIHHGHAECFGATPSSPNSRPSSPSHPSTETAVPKSTSEPTSAPEPSAGDTP